MAKRTSVLLPRVQFMKVLAVRLSTLSHHHMGLLQYCSTSAVEYLEGEGMAAPRRISNNRLSHHMNDDTRNMIWSTENETSRIIIAMVVFGST